MVCNQAESGNLTRHDVGPSELNQDIGNVSFRQAGTFQNFLFSAEKHNMNDHV